MRRQLTIAAVLSAAAFFTAHAANGLVWQSLALPEGASPAAGETASPVPPAGNTAERIELITASTIFAAEIPAGVTAFAAPGAAAAAGIPATAPLDAAKVVKLVGIVVQDGRGALAILQDLSTKRQKGYHPHDSIPGLGEVAEIRRDSIVIHEGNRWELLRLAAALPGPAGGAGADPAEAASNRRILDRTRISKAFAELSAAPAHTYRIQPVSARGGAGGLRLEMYRVDSPFFRLGLQPGDVIQRINGARATDSRVLFDLLSQLQHEQSFTLDLLRRGQPVTMTYEIR